MKIKNKKLVTLLLAGVLSTAAFGVVALDKSSVSADKQTQALTEVFGSNNASTVIGAKKVNKTDETETTAFTLTNGDSVYLKRDLAFHWYEGKNTPAYFTMKFAFETLNFDVLTLTMESISSVATEADKAENHIRFKANGDGTAKAYVLNGKIIEYTAEEEAKLTDAQKEEYEDFKAKENAAFAASTCQVVVGSDITLAFAKATQDPNDPLKDVSFDVTVNGTTVGTFIEMAGNYGDYTYEKVHPLTLTAKSAADVKTVVLLKDINGQKFDNVTSTDANAKYVADTAAPILVVNEDVNGFLLGTAFSLSYEKIDVLQASDLTDTKEYYQYNPTDTEVKYSALSTSVYFMDTVYYVDKAGAAYKDAGEGRTATTVYAENNEEEYVSVQIKLGDKAFSESEGDFAKKVYDLSWYATSNKAVKELTVAETTKDYVVINRNQDGPTYKYVRSSYDATEKMDNEYVDKAKFDSQMEAFKTQLNNAAKDVYAGSNAYIYLPSFEWLFYDNNGYTNLKFTISYKSGSSGSAKTVSSAAYNALKIPTTEEGKYEFKIIASDKANNGMKYYLDGKEVEVTTSNVWDIEKIPSFAFEIANKGIKVDNVAQSSRKSTKTLNETYTFTDIKVIGASSRKSAYKLYYVDIDEYNSGLESGKKQLTRSVLSSISYDKIRTSVEGKLVSVTDGDYFSLYVDAYAQAIASSISGDKAKIVACIKPIQEYNDRITEDDAEWEAYNKYQWKPDSRTFKTVEEGEYLIFADYWESELPMQRAAGYKLISVESAADKIKGESQWLKNNLVSIILFAIAGVMLILIIVLLFVKPNNETLEDVDAKAAKAKAKKSKK